ncbi:MAG: PVC-type heme-binding CxxCH protein [Chryseolinea sp.]
MRSRNGFASLPIYLLSIALLIGACTNTENRDDSKTSGKLFQENIRPTDPRTAEEELKGFILPPGFEIQLFASEPDIEKPMNLSFDAKGRMWVTSSFEYPFPVVGKRGTDKLTILEDTDGDGKADKFTRLSDTLNIPIGILPLNDGAISFSVPSVYRLRDENHDDKMESYKFIFGPFGYQDTHGMVSNFIRGYDGWVHACHGFTNRSKFAGTDGDSVLLVSGNTFRFKLDGSHVQQLTFGQVNPFGLVFDQFGYVYSTDSHSSPLYQLIRTGDYPHFGKISNMGFGPDMKSLKDEATALCGITQYADKQFPEEFQGNFFIGDVVNSRVHRYSYVWKGSSPVGKSEEDFIKSEDPWFRPVNVKLGPDGAIYVADFYNAIIGHYEVPLNHPKRDKQRGRIWRITYKGKKNERMDLTQSTLDKLIEALDTENLPTRMAATDQITDRIGESAADALQKTVSDPATSPRKMVHSLWALYRLNKLSDETLKSALSSKDSIVRIHSMRVLLEKHPDEGLYDIINNGLSDPSPHVRRAAVEVLVKYPSIKSMDAVLSQLKKTDGDYDKHLYYTCRLALRNILRNEPVLKEAVAKSWAPEDAALIAGVMVDVPLPESANFLANYLNTAKLPDERVPAAYIQIARFIPIDQLSAVVNHALSGDRDINFKALIYKGLMEGMTQRAGTKNAKVFEAYAPHIAEELLKKYPATDTADVEEKFLHQRTAVEIAGDYKMKSLEPALKAFLDEGHKVGWTIRNTALRSLMKINPENAILGAKIIENDSVREYQRRTAAVLGEFPGKGINKVLDAIKVIPSEVQESVVAALAGSSEGKDIVFKKVKSGEIKPRALAGPRTEELMLSKATEKQQKEFESLTSNLSSILAETQKLIEIRYTSFQAIDRKTFSIDSGKMVFEQNCAVCHKLGGQMGVGPQLDGIGSTGAAGLTEKILDPNRNISLAFKNYTIKLKDGTLKAGLFRRDEGEAKIFADITGKEFSIAKKDIAEQKQSKYTLMPDSFGATIKERDFYSLINYLLTL